MGHHPLQQVGTNAVQGQTVSSGLSPGTWLIILIVVSIVGYMVYNFIKGGNKS